MNAQDSRMLAAELDHSARLNRWRAVGELFWQCFAGAVLVAAIWAVVYLAALALQH
jgi:hypothetical protein